MDCGTINLKFNEHRTRVIYSNPPLIKSGFDLIFFLTNKMDLKRISETSVELWQSNSDDYVVY